MSWDRDRLAKAGAEEGDKIGLVSVSAPGNSGSTTSSTYIQTTIDATVQWDQNIPPGATVTATLGANGDDGGNQLDVRVQNLTDGETII